MSALQTAHERFSTLWASVHAFGMMAAAALVLALRAPWILAIVCPLSFSVLVVGARPCWTPDGRFGLPNAITTLRLFATLTLLVLHTAWPLALLGAVAFLILVLDALDGSLARRAGQSSDFGARYDVEVDSVLTLALPVLLWVRGVTGPWVLIAGFWRYLYVAAPVMFPVTTNEAERSRFGRWIYALMISAFALAFVLPLDIGRAAAALGTVAVSASFLLSFWQRYRPHPAA